MAFFRFFLLLLIIYLLVEFDILNFKYFFISAAFFPILISLDIIFQNFVGFNIIGLESYSDHHILVGRYVTGFFADELIAGGYIKNFALFSIAFLIFKLKNKRYLKFLSIFIAINVLALGILFSGNRIPLSLFFLGLILIFFLKLNLKKIIIISFIGIYITFNFMFYLNAAKQDELNPSIGFKFEDFYNKGSFLIKKFTKNIIDPDKNGLYESDDWGYIEDKEVSYLFKTQHYRYRSLGGLEEISKDKKSLIYDFDYYWIKNTTRDGHLKLFLTAIDLWKENMILGNGIKSFRLDCAKLQLHKKYRLCSNHPHNYYLEILAETGIAGLFVVLVISFLFIVFILKNFKLLHNFNRGTLILLASTISLFLEAFPVRSSGSIFTTHNATYFILIASIILCYQKILNQENPHS